MAEETTTPKIATETSPKAEETEAPIKQTEAPKEEEAEEAEEVKEIEAETKEMAPLVSDHKRKLEDLEREGEKTDEPDLESNKKEVIEEKINGVDGLIDAKRQRVDGDVEGLDGNQDIQKEAQPMGNGQLPHSENIESGPVNTIQNSAKGVSQQGVLPSAVQQDTAQNSMEGVPQQSSLPSAGQQDASRKIEVPNNKVGVLIGKAGETIRLLQNSSQAKIQITRDAEANPNSSTRPVELIGTLENVNKAEQLIKDVIAEADAGGSPSLVARGFGATPFGSEVHDMQVPSEKVGWIIGKGGEIIKTLQAKSHARIQLIPQHLPEGDFSKERTVRITGNKNQIETAKIMIKDVMNQQPVRQSNPSARQTQGYRPRGPSTQSQWRPRGASPQVQSQMPPNTAYDYLQRGGTYQQPQNAQYLQQPYASGGYPQQPPQRPAAAPVQTPQAGGYDYYGQGGQAMGTQPSSYPSSAPTPVPVNYNNYGQPQPAGGYGHQPNSYTQSAPQQSYGGYENQAQYGQQQQQQPGGYYSQQGGCTMPGYAPQPPPSYGSNPATAAYTGAPPPQSAYGPPANQGSVPSSYGLGGPATQQQPYPYGSSPAPTSQPTAYGQAYGPTLTDGYNQAPPSTAASTGGGYSQPPIYGQGYNTQSGGANGYGQYPAPVAQPPAAYGDQSVPPVTNVNYGYQAGAGGGGYGGSVPPSSGGYGAAAPAPTYGTQPGYGGYVQPPTAAATNYDQSAAGYGSAPPVGYAKGVSQQPAAAAPYGGGGQYDSVPPVYGGHH